MKNKTEGEKRKGDMSNTTKARGGDKDDEVRVVIEQ